MACSKCKKPATVQIFVEGGKMLCQECHMHKYPYRMELMMARGTTRLYNITQQMTETGMRIKQFQNCGWFLRKKIERGTNVYYLLEYHGKKKCSRCDNYHFPLEMKKCALYTMCSWRKGRLGNGKRALQG